MKKTIGTFLIIFSIINIAFTQKKEGKKSFNATTVNISYAMQLPAADLANDFSWNFNFGAGVQYLTKSKWLFGGEAGFMFGNSPNVDVLANLRTVDGEIIAEDKSYGFVLMEGRGFHAGLLVGKIIPFRKKYPHSGIRITVSGGILQHKIRIDDKSGLIPQLAGEYVKGYDRLTYGFSLTEFIGYQHFSNNKRINFFAGFEFTQGFTQNRRSWDYLTQSKLDNNRLDLLNGIRVGWVLPIFHSDSYNAEEIFY